MHSPPRILIVDDNETNRDILITRLGTHGFDLLQAADGEEAIEVTKKSLPDLILLDVMMPKMDGIEATKRIKADASLPFTPIILVTAKTDSKDVITGLEAGADEYLTKPVDQTSLVARVKSMLRIKELHDKVATQAADLAKWNKTLEQRVADQLAEIERAGRAGSSASLRRKSPNSSSTRVTNICSIATAVSRWRPRCAPAWDAWPTGGASTATTLDSALG
jgi:DNA-binding response OmpR family regulator